MFFKQHLCKMEDINKVLGNTFLVLSWLVVLILSIYLMYQVIKYFYEKPPNTQTLIVGLYIEMFSIWIYDNLVAVGIRVDMKSFIIGNATGCLFSHCFFLI